MSDTETYYLIDFENVNEDGLFCPDELGMHDHIHLFSTENAPKISLALLSRFNSAQFCSHIVSAGKQSLDMHLVAYLGYLLGTTCRENTKYVIVSRDADYDKVIAFLQTQAAADITRRAAMTPKAAQPGKSTPKSLVAKPVNAGAKKTAAQNRVQQNNEIQKILAQAGFGSDVIGFVASLSVKQHNKKNAKDAIYRAIVAKFGQKQGLNIYNHIKKII